MYEREELHKTPDLDGPAAEIIDLRTKLPFLNDTLRHIPPLPVDWKMAVVVALGCLTMIGGVLLSR